MSLERGLFENINYFFLTMKNKINISKNLQNTINFRFIKSDRKKREGREEKERGGGR